MNIKLKIIFSAASIFIMLAVAAVIIFTGRSEADYEEKLESAGIYLENRDYDNAIAIYNKIIAENRTCAEAYAGLSEAYFAKNRTDKAFEILEKGARNTDSDPIVLDKIKELFPDGGYDGLEDDIEDYPDGVFAADLPQTETSVTETSAEETSSVTNETAVTTVPEESETETATTSTVPVTETTAVPTTTTATTTAATTTAAATTTTTAAPIVITTAAPPVTTVTTRATTVQTTETTTVTTTEEPKDVSVPDLTRMSLDEAYAWCSKNNLILNVVGTEEDSAKILSQSPPPNSIVKENSTVIAVLDE